MIFFQLFYWPCKDLTTKPYKLENCKTYCQNSEIPKRMWRHRKTIPFHLWSCSPRGIQHSTFPFVTFFQRDLLGQSLLEVVYARLNLLETSYFGLRYLDFEGQTVSALKVFLRPDAINHTSFFQQKTALAWLQCTTLTTAQREQRHLRALLLGEVLCRGSVQVGRGNHPLPVLSAAEARCAARPPARHLRFGIAAGRIRRSM